MLILLLILVLVGAIRANYDFLIRFISCGMIFALLIAMSFRWGFLFKFDMLAHIHIR